MKRITINLSGAQAARFQNAKAALEWPWISDAGFARYLTIIGLDVLELQADQHKPKAPRKRRNRKEKACK